MSGRSPTYLSLQALQLSPQSPAGYDIGLGLSEMALDQPSPIHHEEVFATPSKATHSSSSGDAKMQRSTYIHTYIHTLIY